MKEYHYCPICATPLQIGFIAGRRRKYCPKCDFVDYRNPLPVAVAVAVKGKRFLLIKRGSPPQRGTWGSPSGFIESGETPEEACLRELKEETGISGEIARLIGVIGREDKEIYGDMVVVRYLVKIKSGKITPGDEVENAKFFDIAELPSYYVDIYKDLIEEIQNGEVF
jgi:ADP-ribose pyrophosphatase YjhB (NUDIX family)